MKFNYKKIASVLASTVMLGSTIAFASASWEPLVKDGTPDAAIVVGTSAVASDMTAAVELGAELDKSVTVTSGSTTATEGDKVKLEKSADKFNLQDSMNSFFATLDSEDLSLVLADGTYLNDDNNDYDFEQTIALDANQLTFSKDKDYNGDKPQPGFYLSKGAEIMNYTLDFTDSAECGTAFASCDNTDIEMLGKKFFISNAESVGANVKLTLLDSANLATVAEGETKTVTVGDKTYEVSIDFVAGASGNDAAETKLTVNGITTNSLNEGETYKLTDGTFVGVKDISYSSKESGISKVQFSLGMGKLVLQNGAEVQLNDEDISTLEDANGVASVITATIANTTTNIDSITLNWVLDTDAVIAPGYDLSMPGFNAIKVSMSAFTAPMQEKTTVENDQDSIVLTAPVKDGTLELPFLYGNSTQFLGLGADADNVLVTNKSVGTSSVATSLLLNNSAMDSSSFVVTYIKGDEAETYAYELGSIVRSDNQTTLKSLVGGKDVVLKEVTDTAEVGNIEFKLANVDGVDQDWALIQIKSTVSGGNVYTDRVATKEGLTLKLPVLAANLSAGDTTDGFLNVPGVTINATGTGTVGVAIPSTWKMNITEENNDGDIAVGGNFTLTTTVGADGPEVTATSLTTQEEEKASDWEVALAPTDLATKVRLFTPSGSSSALGLAEVIYAGEESTADVYVSESAVSFSGAQSIKVVKDSEIDSVKAKNLIVVGGSCINTVAATLLGSATPLCGDAFAAKTLAGPGKYLIQTFPSTYDSAKVAMLVAGYDAAETTAAVAKVKEGKIAISVDTEKMVGPTAI